MDCLTSLTEATILASTRSTASSALLSSGSPASCMADSIFSFSPSVKGSSLQYLRNSTQAEVLLMPASTSHRCAVSNIASQSHAAGSTVARRRMTA